MTVNERIIAALGGFGDPAAYGAYITAGAQKADQYYVFNYSTLGTDYADDTPGHERYLIQVHFFCPRVFDSVLRVAQTKQKLFAAGFTWPSVINASDEDGQHIVFECEIAAAAGVE